MAEELIAEQKAQLITWAEQRDEILSQLSNLRTEEEKLQLTNKELAASNTDITSNMDVIRGRIEELKIKEAELPPLMLKEVAFLESKKSTVQSEIIVLGKLLEVLKTQKESIETDITQSLAIFEVVKGETLLLDKIVGHVIGVSNKSVTTVDALVASVKISMQDLLDVNKVIVDKANNVIQELPRVFLEVQRQSLDRKRIDRKTN